MVPFLLVPFTLVAASSYQRVLSVDNSSFLDAFAFFTADDPTHGSVTYISAEEALVDGLVKLANGQIFMSTDMKSTKMPRRSVRVFSKQTYSKGLVIIDLEHIPTGCGTWPAFWLCGPAWPNSGEIDILEGVHTQTKDLTTLHTSEGCSMAGVDRMTFTGHWAKGIGGEDATDCYIKAPSESENQGCGVIDDNEASFGAPFNTQRGGVVATVWDVDGIRAYSWPRGHLPVDVATRSPPNESSWGVPYARFEFGKDCDAAHFHDQQLIFDLTLCGDWAGSTFAEVCPSEGGSCDAFIADPANMQEAYWRVNYVDVWQDAVQATPPGSSEGRYFGPAQRTRARQRW